MGLFSRLAFAHSALSADAPASSPVSSVSNLSEYPSSEAGSTFSSVVVDPAFFGITETSSIVQPSVAPRISRSLAIQVPAVKRSRDLIAGTLGALPLDVVGPDKSEAANRLLEQPEVGVPRSATMTRTFEDLLFEGVAWWRVVEFGWHGYPVRVVRLDPRTVNVAKDGRVYVTRQGNYGETFEYVDDAELIRFDSPSDALLEAGARAIRTALLLDAAAARYSEGAPPLDYFTPAEGADAADDAAIVEMLTAWQTARQTRSTGYVPAALQYNSGGFSPEQLQMADARQHAVLEIARAVGLDPEDLGVSTTSRTYQNSQDRRKSFIDFALGGYRAAVEDRLSMNDVTPRGYSARFNLSAFLRSDDLTRMQTYEIAQRVGALTREETRELEDRPALDATDSAALPAPTDSETAA